MSQETKKKKQNCWTRGAINKLYLHCINYQVWKSLKIINKALVSCIVSVQKSSLLALKTADNCQIVNLSSENCQYASQSAKRPASIEHLNADWHQWHFRCKCELFHLHFFALIYIIFSHFQFFLPRCNWVVSIACCYLIALTHISFTYTKQLHIFHFNLLSYFVAILMNWHHCACTASNVHRLKSDASCLLEWQNSGWRKVKMYLICIYRHLRFMCCYYCYCFCFGCLTS